ncbi:MAG: S8 family serine peptidase, partial [Bacteroidota bacterium]
MNRLVLILVFLLTIFSTTITVAQQLSYNPEVLDYALELEIVEAPEQTYRAYILLKDQVNMTELKQQFEVLRASRAQRARTIVNQLKDKAAQSQAGFIRELQGSAEVIPGSIKPYWITNMVLVEATGNYLAQLSLHPAVQQIEEAFVDQIHKGKTSVPEELALVPNGREPGLTTIKANKLWEMGYTGYGTKVMIIDTEIDFDHPALRTQFLYNNVPVEQAYFGQISGELCFDHGTTVVGVVLGLDRMTNDTIGVAFNAKYMNGPVPFVDEDGNECVPPGERTTSVDALQYALNPDGNSNTTSDIPDVINNSYGTPITNSRDCQNPIQRNIYTNLDAAGVSVIFSAGNAGPEEGTLNLQSSLNFDLYTPFVVGSIESNNTISEFSSRGPSLCIDGPNSFKPDVVAPGAEIRTSRPGNGYTSISGTSFSAPYVTGAVLLLKEAFPNLTGRRLNEALTVTATDLGSSGDDNIFGRGLIDVYAAYIWLINQGHTPTPALRSANDAILTDVETRNVECGRMIQPILTITNNGTEDITSLEINFQRESDRSNLSPVNWTGRIPVGETKKITVGPINA